MRIARRKLASGGYGWYVVFQENGRWQRVSLRTADRREAERNLKLWLDERQAVRAPTLTIAVLWGYDMGYYNTASVPRISGLSTREWREWFHCLERAKNPSHLHQLLLETGFDTYKAAILASSLTTPPPKKANPPASHGPDSSSRDAAHSAVHNPCPDDGWPNECDFGYDLGPR